MRNINDVDQEVQDREEEAIAIAGRLAEISSTASPSQLREMLDEYARTLKVLEEGDDVWLKTLQHDLHESSV